MFNNIDSYLYDICVITATRGCIALSNLTQMELPRTSLDVAK